MIDYDRWAERQLATEPNRAGILRWKVDTLAALIPAGDRVVSIGEIGCAEGEIVSGLAARLGVSRVVGLDLSERFLCEARARHPGFLAVRTDGRTIPLRDRALDLLVVSDLLEHLEDPRALLLEARRVARRLLAKIPIERALLNSALLQPIGWNPPPGPEHPSGHLREYTPASGLRELLASGWRPVARRLIATPLAVVYENRPALRHRLFAWLGRTGLGDGRLGREVFGANLFALCEPVRI